jgi:hypothetical protein
MRRMNYQGQNLLAFSVNSLEIFDPNLSLALSDLVYYKFSVLLLASHSFNRKASRYS